MTEISTGLEEIKQMLLGMQQRNKEFCDEQVIQIRSLRHTLSQAAAEHSRLQTLMAEPTQGFENPGSVETPVLKNDEDDSEIDGKGYDIEDNLSAVAEEKFVELPAVPSSAVVKVQFMPQYNFFIIDNIAECMEVCPVPSNYSEKTLEKFCTPGVCINVPMDMCSQLTASLSLNCTGRNFTGLKCEDSIHVGLDKPPPLPPEITLHVTNMVLGASFSSILECKNYDKGGQVQSIGGTNFTGFDLASLYATYYIHLGVSDSSLDHVLLLSYCPTHGANFVEQASKFDQVVSREDVIKSVTRIPSRRTEHSFALIGEPSVYSQRIRMQISSHPRRYSRPPAMEIAFSLKVFSCIFRSVHNYFRMNFSCSAIIFQLPLSRTSTAFWQQFTNTLTIISIEFQDHSSITSAEAIQHQFIDITAAVGIIFSAYPATFQQRFRNHTRYCISPPQSQELEILYFTAGNCFTSYHKRAGHKIMNALDIHKRAGQQEISLSNFYEICKGLEHTIDLQFSALWVPTNSFLATRTREECIRESPRVVIVSLEILELPERLPHSFLGPAPNPFMVYDLNASSNHTAMPMTVQMASMSQIQQPNLFGFHLTTAYDCKREDLDSTWEALTYFLTWVRESEHNGLMEKNVVHIPKCRFLQESNCVGMCTNLCKFQSQAFIKDSLGMPVNMVPNFDDMSCQMVFGQEPPSPDEDPALKQPCYKMCKTKQRHSTGCTSGQHKETSNLISEERLSQTLPVPK